MGEDKQEVIYVYVKEKNPSTGDNKILSYIVTSFLMISIIGFTIYFLKKNK